MQRQLRVLAAIVVLAPLVAALPAPAARAYLAEATTLLGEVAERRAELDASTLFAEGYVPGADPVITTQTWIITGRGMRTEHATAEGSTEVELTLGRDRYRFLEGEPAPAPTRLRAAPLFELLGTAQKDPGGQRGLELLARLQVDPAIVALDRFDGRPVYVIGARPGDVQRPQLWIDKRYLVPVRWIAAAESGGLEDVRLYGYGMPTTGPWWPERVETWRGTEQVSVVQYTRVKLNARAPARLLAPPATGG